jgi:hypothetical protein
MDPGRSGKSRESRARFAKNCAFSVSRRRTTPLPFWLSNGEGRFLFEKLEAYRKEKSFGKRISNLAGDLPVAAVFLQIHYSEPADLMKRKKGFC